MAPREWPRLLLRAAAAVVTGGILATVGRYVYFFGYFVFMLTTTRPPNWDVIHARGSDCQFKDHQALSNHHDTVAILREANCPGLLAQGTIYNVIFVHSARQANDRNNLAFQYTPGFVGYKLSPLPKIAWTSPTLLAVSVSGVIEVIQVQRMEVGRTKLSYKLGAASREFPVDALLWFFDDGLSTASPAGTPLDMTAVRHATRSARDDKRR